jgi:hypothetical protein
MTYTANKNYVFSKNYPTMKKIIMVILFAAITAFMTVSAIYCNKVIQNELLSANIEALAEDESLSHGEYIDPLDPQEPKKPHEGLQAVLVETEKWDIQLKAFVKQSSWECIKVSVSISCTFHF